MRVKQMVAVLAEELDIRAALLKLVAESETLSLAEDSVPAAVLIGCRSRIARSDISTAKSLQCGSGAPPIVLITTHGSEELAVQAMRAGIVNYFRMPDSPAVLDRVMQEVLTAPGAAPGRDGLDRIIGDSLVMRNLKAYLRKAAACSANVLVTGETGCGKEMVAELIHQFSPRSSRPFITVNCAAIPDSLIESELFGFERGAFTGAHTSQEGKLKLADEGTVFLDEIGDLTQYAQAKLLRTIESGEIQRLGGRKPQRVNVRVVAATNRELDDDPTFRKDLFFRLNVARIHLPPLRERKDDILPLAEAFRREFDRKFARRTTGFTASAREVMLAHTWPGNIRELRNIIEAAFIDLHSDATEVDVPQPFRRAVMNHASADRGELERILLALSETRWNKSRAAERLEWSRMTLYRKMALYRIVKTSRAAS